MCFPIDLFCFILLGRTEDFVIEGAERYSIVSGAYHVNVGAIAPIWTANGATF